MNAFTPYGEPPAHVTAPDQDRPLPHNTDAEQALLGAALTWPAVFDEVKDLLRPEHFFDALHGRIYSAIGKLVEAGQRANPVTLKNHFDQDAALTQVGGAKYLVELASAAVPGAEGYAGLIIDLAKRRRLIALARQAEAEAFIFDADVPIDAYMAKVEKDVAAISSEGSTGEQATRLDHLMQAEVQRIRAASKEQRTITGITSGLTDLDRKLGGFQEEELIILAGRPSMGKSALAFGFCGAAVRAGNPSDFYSQEMGDRQIANRKIAELTGISADRQRRGDVTEFDLDDIEQRIGVYAGLPIYIDPTPALTVPMLRAKARYQKVNRGTKLIVVDYLQLMRGTGSAGRSAENRTQELSEITRGLKALAKELKVPVIALSQLSRAVEQRDDKRPMLSDLRESGSIEQDADVVLFVFREEYYVERAEPKQRAGENAAKYSERIVDWSEQLKNCAGKADIIIAKQRQGPIGTVTTAFDGRRFMFSDL